MPNERGSMNEIYSGCGGVLVELDVNDTFGILVHNRAGVSMVCAFGIGELDFERACLGQLDR